MSQVASLNAAERGFGFGPAQASRGARAPAGLIGAAAFAAALVLLPIMVTIVQAAGVSAQGAAALLIRPLVGRLLVNTVGLVVAASVTCAAIGTATAWLVERTDLPGRKVWAVLAVAPLAIPPFISSYAWVSLSNGLQDFGGALLVVTCAYYPLVYLPVAAALRGLDPGLEETARSLGHGPWACFFRVVAPQLRPALYGGILLVALDVLIEFGAFALLRFRTFTTELYAQYRTGLDGPESSLLALVLVALCLLCVVGELRVRGKARYARVGSGARRVAAPARLGWVWFPALAAFVALTTATLGVPVGMVGYWLMQHAHAATSPARAVLAASLRRDTRFRELRTGRSRRGHRACGAARLSRDALSEPPVDRARTDRLSRAGRAGHRRRAGVHFADDPDGPPAVPERRRCSCWPMRSCFCRSLWSGSVQRWRRSSSGSRRPAARSGSGGLRSLCGSSRRWWDRALAPEPRWCSFSSPLS